MDLLKNLKRGRPIGSIKKEPKKTENPDYFKEYYKKNKEKNTNDQKKRGRPRIPDELKKKFDYNIYYKENKEKILQNRKIRKLKKMSIFD